MKKSILRFAAGVLITAVVMMCHTSNRKNPTSSTASAHIAGDEDEKAESKARVRSTPAAVSSADPKVAKDISRGIASFYGVNTNGTRTASGIPLDDSKSTAAHRTLPFGTFVRVTNLSNGLKAVVKITDRGPYIKSRIIDVSRNAAEKLDMIQAGVVSVEVEVLPGATDPTQASLAED